MCPRSTHTTEHLSVHMGMHILVSTCTLQCRPGRQKKRGTTRAVSMKLMHVSGISNYGLRSFGPENNGQEIMAQEIMAQVHEAAACTSEARVCERWVFLYGYEGIPVWV